MELTPDRYALGSLIVGACLLVPVWLRHEAGRHPAPVDGGEWTNPPGRLIPLVRHGAGPVYVMSVLAELVGLTFVLRGLAVAAGLQGGPLDVITSAAIKVSLALIVVGWIWFYWRGRRA
jgi:hypothetical protein